MLYAIGALLFLALVLYVAFIVARDEDLRSGLLVLGIAIGGCGVGYYVSMLFIHAWRWIDA